MSFLGGEDLKTGGPLGSPFNGLLPKIVSIITINRPESRPHLRNNHAECESACNNDPPLAKIGVQN